MLARTVDIENKKGLIAIIRIKLVAVDCTSWLDPLAIIETSGSAKINIRILEKKVTIASKLSKLEDKRHAELLLLFDSRWFKTGIKVTLRAPETNR